MASRSAKKRQARGGSPNGDSAATGADDVSGPSGRLGERIAELVFGVIIFFGGGAYAGISIFESWRLALIFGVAGAVLAVVLVSRGEKLGF